MVRPLWHEFPQDSTTLDIDFQFLWGSSFMISPALERNQVEVNAYFPQGLWYDYFTRQQIGVAGEFINIQCDLDCIPLHIRGGSILPAQVI